MRGRKRHSVAAMSGLFLDVSWRCRQRAARARKHHVTDWRKMRTIECSAGESLDENVPAGIVLQLTWLLLVGSPEAGFYFWTLLQYLRVIYFDRAAICFFWIVSEKSHASLLVMIRYLPIGIFVIHTLTIPTWFCPRAWEKLLNWKVSHAKLLKSIIFAAIELSVMRRGYCAMLLFWLMLKQLVCRVSWYVRVSILEKWSRCKQFSLHLPTVACRVAVGAGRWVVLRSTWAATDSWGYWHLTKTICTSL